MTVWANSEFIMAGSAPAPGRSGVRRVGPVRERRAGQLVHVEQDVYRGHPEQLRLEPGQRWCQHSPAGQFSTVVANTWLAGPSSADLAVAEQHDAGRAAGEAADVVGDGERW